MSSAGSSTEQGPPATAANSSRTRFGQPTTRSEAGSSPNCTRSQSGLSSTGSSTATAHHCQTSKASPPPRNRARSSCSRGRLTNGRIRPQPSTIQSPRAEQHPARQPRQRRYASRRRHARSMGATRPRKVRIPAIGVRRRTRSHQDALPRRLGRTSRATNRNRLRAEPKKSVRRGCLFLGGFELFPERNSTHGLAGSSTLTVVAARLVEVAWRCVPDAACPVTSTTAESVVH